MAPVRATEVTPGGATPQPPMSTAAPRALDAAVRPEARSERAAAPRGMARSLAQLLASNALIGVTGLACLPVLFRNLGAASYGQLSLFLTLLGLVGSLDVARPTLVRELSRDGGSARLDELLPLVGSSQWIFAPLALVAGGALFGPAAAIALATGTWLFVAASAPYAALAAEGRVGLAGGVRNVAWAAAFLTATGLSFLELPSHAPLWPFVAANLAVLLVNRRLCGSPGPALFHRPRLGVWRRFQAQSLDILGLSLAVAVLVSTDRLLLEEHASGEVFGHYAAQYDLAIRLNMLSTALGTVLLPALSRRVAGEGFEEAARAFVRQASWIVSGFFLVVVALLLLEEQVLRLFLGAPALEAARVYPLLLLGVFVGLSGHLLTPWQRSIGDFRTHRRIYALAAVLMLAVGLHAVPRFGALGALATYAAARSADLLMLAAEVRRLPRRVLPAWRLGLLAAMVVALALLAARAHLSAGGAA